MTHDIWILGATGRIGRAVAARLAHEGASVTLVGRDPARLASVGEGFATLVVPDLDAVPALIETHRPAVVINVAGEYARTAVAIARACLPGGHYVDLAADPTATTKMLSLNDDAVREGSTFVTAAGFGVLATEALVVRLCDGKPVPHRVRVDALGSVAMEAGLMGSAFAAAIVGMIMAGGRQYRDGRLVRTRLGAGAQTLALPDGETIKSAGAPTAELEAAHRASGSPNVSVTSALVPTALPVRLMLPAMQRLLFIPALRRMMINRLALTSLKEAPRPRPHSYGHAVIEWTDGTRREGWLQAEDAMDYTADVATEVALRLLRGEGPAGAYTPAAAFGASLATVGGASFILV